MQQILAFEHPQAGVQLVKGAIGRGESVRAAALRELAEEAGIADTGVLEDLGTWESGHRGHVWSLQLCAFPRELPESWTYHCVDRGGRQFRFFWHDVNRAPDENWRPHFRRALDAIRERTRPLRWRG